MSRRTPADMEALRTAIVSILQEDHPMGVRGVFYRLLSLGLVRKTVNESILVGDQLVVLRQEGQVPWEWVEDNTRRALQVPVWSDAQAALGELGRQYRRDPWQEQPRHVEVWIEKDGLVGSVGKAANPFAVRVMAVRGYPSHTFLHDAGEHLKRVGKPCHIIQLGDHDPDGKAIVLFTERELRQYAGPDTDLHFERVALNERQIDLHHLPTRPDKKGGVAVDLDALPPEELRRLVRGAIERHIDADAWALSSAASERDAERLIATILPPTERNEELR